MFYFTDIHGNLDLFNSVMELIKDEPLIFGGDACDRGDHGYEIMKSLLNREHTIYLKGNHEDMFVKAAYAIYQHVKDDELDPAFFHDTAYEWFNHDEDIALCLYNGGLQTLTDWINDGMSMAFVRQIEILPVHYSTDHYDFCHAGCMRECFERATWDYYDAYSAIWDRKHFNYAWIPGRRLIHGHTPVEAMPGKWRCSNLPILYCGGGKLNMDGGAHYLGQTFVWEVGTDNYWRIKRYGNDFIDMQPIQPMDRTQKSYFDFKTGEMFNGSQHILDDGDNPDDPFDIDA